MAQERNIVYSTSEDWAPPKKKKAHKSTDSLQKSGTVKIQREKKGRAGKTVTVVYGINANLKTIQKELQKHCGTGGSSKNGTIEIQGDHGPKIKDYLEAKGIKAKLAGGY